MIETRVRIVSVEGNTVWVAPNDQSVCDGCQSKKVCGMGGLGRYLNAGIKPIQVACDGAAQAGDELVVTVPEAVLIKAGLLAYLLPSLLAVLCAGAVSLTGAGDSFSVLAAVMGCASGLLISRVFSRATPLRAHHPTNSIH